MGFVTYTNNRAIISDRKGIGRGIDGAACFLTGSRDNARIIFQVKSGPVQRADIAALRDRLEREQAMMAVLITLEKPTPTKIQEAKAAGLYRQEDTGRNHDRIQLVTIKEILEQDKRLDVKG